MVAGDLTELVQDALLVEGRGLVVPRVDRVQVLPFRLMTHAVTLLWSGDREGNILDGAMIPPSVTF